MTIFIPRRINEYYIPVILFKLRMFLLYSKEVDASSGYRSRIECHYFLPFHREKAIAFVAQKSGPDAPHIQTAAMPL